MPLPIFHLGTARRFTAEYKELVTCPDFYLGSIAPDAVLYRKGWTQALKDVAHLRNEEPDRWEANIIDFIQKNNPLKPFETGYTVHLLTDCFWLKEYYHRLTEKFDAAGTPKEERSRIHHREQSELSYRFNCEESWVKELFLLLGQAVPLDFPPYVFAEEIREFRDSTITWYNKEEHIPANTNTEYLDTKLLEEFMTDAAVYCKKKLLDASCSGAFLG